MAAVSTLQLVTVDWCAAECARQQAGPLAVARMFRAWTWAESHRRAMFTPEMLEKSVKLVAAIVDPCNHAGYRRSHVGFVSGGTAAQVDDIAPMMARWAASAVDAERGDADIVAKTFLAIHPYADGNGRTASIIWNLVRLNRRPKMMPDFYG